MTRKDKKIQALGGNVLAKIRWLHRKAFFRNFIEKFRMD